MKDSSLSALQYYYLGHRMLVSLGIILESWQPVRRTHSIPTGYPFTPGWGEAI